MEVPSIHVRKNDVVQVRIGKERGKTGKVLRVINKTGYVVIEKLNIVKRHTKPTGKSPGGIVEKEAPIAASNVLLFCEKCGRGVRFAKKADDKGTKHRHCRKCDSKLDK